ncbi:N-acetyltransferase [Marinactinospora thermotolerans]|uniref:N-acetyltransferase n=1 Tax=Marinactinospora thermotolerans TaxID=531310 RepID=UPI001F1F7458|nr:N-acetyltransferase [Marinactinospora thermotolerans]
MIYTVAERPDLLERMYELDGTFAPFMSADPVLSSLFAHRAVFADYTLLAFDPADPDRIVGRAVSVPFRLSRGDDETAELPESGWDQVVSWAVEDHHAGVRTDTVSALEISLAPDYLGRGLSSVMLRAMRDNCRRLGYDTLVAPVRPTAKHLHPRVPMEEYVTWTREDGLPHDPWLRVHARLGATIEGVAPLSMTIPATLAQWREWTGLPFDASGPVEVPGALVPVVADIEHGYAVYVEPNVWMRHRL